MPLALLELFDLRLQVLKPLVGGLQRLILNEHRLRQEIGSIGLRADGVRDQRLGLRIARYIGGPLDAVEKTVQQLAFFG